MKNDKKIIDLDERLEALDVKRSFIVQAPAGSGKTELLMQRFLSLLATVAEPEGILAMTFTRKAAGELRHRVISALLVAANPEKDDGTHQKKTIELAREALKKDVALEWNLLENPGKLNIRTIDSLCAALVRQQPLLSRVGASALISEDPDELYALAARLTIEAVEDAGPDADAVFSALKHMDNSVTALTDRLVMMLKSRDQWMRHVEAARSDKALLKVSLESAFEKLVSHELEKAMATFPAEYAEDILTLSRYAAANIENSESFINRLADMNEVPSARVEDLPLWHGLRELFITKDGNGWRKRVDKGIGFPALKGKYAEAKKKFLELLAGIEPNDNFFQALSCVNGLPAPKFSEDEWEILISLIKLLPVALKRLNTVFVANGTADFQEVSMAALSSLGSEESPTDLMLSMDWKLAHILVDEYQDTSRTQLFLLRALTRGWTSDDGRTLFVVGDPMQSIFGFREADVGLFMEARKLGIGTVLLTPLTLKTNFRSTSAIVNWINKSFAPSFPPIEDVFTGAVKYSLSEAFEYGVDDAGVSVTLYDGTRDRADTDRAEAEKIAEIIKGVRPGETVAVLCRSRSHLAEVVNIFKKQGIGFSAEDFDTLSGRPVIQDLFALSRALTHPFDRTAWLALLRAPWCGLSLADMLHIVSGDNSSPIAALLKDDERLNKLTDAGRARLLSFTRKFEKALQLKGRVSFRRVLEGVWIDIGGPACVSDESALNDAEIFFETIDLVSRGGDIDVKKLRERVSKLYAGHGKAEDFVSLMTVHKAKGLEFDHVIVPGLGKISRNENKRLLLWLERGDDLLLAPVEKKVKNYESPLYDFLFAFNNKKKELERTRLFYVACTRAKKRLYLLGHARLTADGPDKGKVSPEKRSFLYSINHILNSNMFEPMPAVEVPVEPVAPLFQLKRLSSTWKRPEPNAGILLDAPDEVIAAGVEPEFYWAGEAARHLGTVVHAYLCRVAKDGLWK
ncbi:DNA helicase UvrD, partial [bacterium]